MPTPLIECMQNAHRVLLDACSVDLQTLPLDDELRDLLVGLEALGNTVEAIQGRVMVEMNRRADAEDLRLDAMHADTDVPGPRSWTRG